MILKTSVMNTMPNIQPSLWWITINLSKVLQLANIHLLVEWLRPIQKEALGTATTILCAQDYLLH